MTDSLTGVTDSEYDVNGDLIMLTSPQGTIKYTYNLATGLETESHPRAQTSFTPKTKPVNYRP